MSDSRGDKPRVLVVDGDTGTRHDIARLLGERGAFEVVGTAINARTALPKTEAYRPDVLTVDLVSDGVEGLALVETLRRNQTSVGLVLMVQDSPSADQLRLRLELAPFEVVLRAEAIDAIERQLLPAVTRVANAIARATGACAGGDARERSADCATPTLLPPPAISMPQLRVPRRGAAAEIVGIGTSTGGPNALARLLPQLPADFPLPILVVQHMPPGYTASLAQSLASACKLRVREAQGGEVLTGGEVLIAPGGRHLRVVRTALGVETRITEDPPENSCRPAVDYLFRSLHEVYGAATIAVVMTGMGEDGFRGCQQLRAAGAQLLAQDAASCTVYGMPRLPTEAGIIDVVAPLDQLAARICEAAGARIQCN